MLFCAQVCIRDSAFVQNPRFVEEVPKATRLAFIENNPIARAAAQAFQRTLIAESGDAVVQYEPTFVSYTDQVPLIQLSFRQLLVHLKSRSRAERNSGI